MIFVGFDCSYCLHIKCAVIKINHISILFIPLKFGLVDGNFNPIQSDKENQTSKCRAHRFVNFSLF